MASLDRQNAETARYFHHGDDCAQVVTYGPRGGAQYPRTELWRRNGATKTWKREPDRYQVPVKYGMRSYGYLTERDIAWHIGTPEECPDGTLAASLAADVQRRFDDANVDPSPAWIARGGR